MKNYVIGHLYLTSLTLSFESVPHALRKKELHSLEKLLWCTQSHKFLEDNKGKDFLKDFLENAQLLLKILETEKAKAQNTHDDLRRIKKLIQQQFHLPYQNVANLTNWKKFQRVKKERLDFSTPINETIKKLTEIVEKYKEAVFSEESRLEITRLECEEETRYRLRLEEENRNFHEEQKKTLLALLEQHKEIFLTKQDVLNTGKLIVVGENKVRLIPSKVYNYLYTLFSGELVISITGTKQTIEKDYTKLGKNFIPHTEGSEWLEVGFIVS